MKIGWASPWNVHSAIAKAGKDVVRCLSQAGHDVEILRTEVGEAAELPPLEDVEGVRVSILDGTAPPDIYDAIVVNIGDHFGFHGGVMPLLFSGNPVVVFHDAFLANFCSGLAETTPNPPQALRSMVAAAYGGDEIGTAEPYWLPELDMLRRRPMIELFAARAVAAVVHADHYRARVASACPGPVAHIPLSYPDLEVAPPRPIGPNLRIATIGHANANKRITEVIAAIGGSELLRPICSYTIIGFIEDAERERIESTMLDYDFTAVEFTGRVTDAELRRTLADIDVICCLRYPLLEGASASLVTAMLTARPVLVSHHGVYAEIPDGLVLKCAPGQEGPDIRRHLEGIVRTTGNEHIERGQRARAYVLQAQSGFIYATNIIDLITRSQESGPASQVALQFGEILGSLGLAGRPSVYLPVENVIAELFSV